MWEPKCHKHPSVGPKVHVAVARSTFRSQNAKNTTCKLRCGKSARGCGATRVGSQNAKDTSVSDQKWTWVWREAHLEVKMLKAQHARTRLEVEISKKCTLLWREAHLEGEILKNHILGALLEVEVWKKCTRLWREAHLEGDILKNHILGALLEVDIFKKCTRF